MKHRDDVEQDSCRHPQAARSAASACHSCGGCRWCVGYHRAGELRDGCPRVLAEQAVEVVLRIDGPFARWLRARAARIEQDTP
jgi:hypothetical protein